MNAPGLLLRSLILAGTAATSALTTACAAGGDAPSPSRFGADSTLWRRMFEAEDARGGGAEGIAPLLEGTQSQSPAIRTIAVRGLGRLERAALADTVASFLGDPDAAVRIAAAHALAQSVRSADTGPARTLLLSKLAAEPDGAVRGALAESFGRLPADAASLAGTASRIAAGVAAAGAAERLGVARAYYFLARQRPVRGAMPTDAVDALRDLTSIRPDAADAGQRTRTLAASALVSAGMATAEDIRRLLGDPEPLVRREIALAIPALPDRAVAVQLAEMAAADTSAMVRFEGVRAWDRVRDPARPCQRTIDAAADANPHVALLAIDLLGTGCGGPAAAAILDSVTGSIRNATATTGWHRAAHALVSLARVAPSVASTRLSDFDTTQNAFVRAWAARAAAVLGNRETLRRMANDPDANVRTEAVTGLSAAAGHAGDSVYIAQLRDRDESQLLQAAAAALEGSSDPAAMPALLEALDRVSAARRETWRDSRMALLTRIGELGTPASADRLRPYLRDYDPRVAETAARQVASWTSAPATADPQPLPRLALPAESELEALASTTVTFEMESGGMIRIELMPFVAPTNAFRFARLAREGYFDGLTVHRIAPNFVVQGGSPGANEYTGDGPFTRDEPGRAFNWRGTVGLSTRGRDTGDAQFYVNLIDNTRLDHDYTIYGRVASGMEVVDGLLEGDVIRRATVSVSR